MQQVSRMVPGSDPEGAWREAEAIFDTAFDMTPEDAARIWISVPLPDGMAAYD